MRDNRRLLRAFCALLFALLIQQLGFAGVSRPIQDRYRHNYENKALFLKIPIFAERQYVNIAGKSIHPEPGTGAPRFKVGDQLRVLGIDFGGDEIKFKLGTISGPMAVEVVFKFDSGLTENFPNSDVFDRALQATFTEGLKYSDLDEAKRAYVEDQFDNAVREIASAAATSREVVLKAMAPHIPAYMDAIRDIENLKARNQDLGGQVGQAQSENRRLESETKSQQAEIAKLRNTNASLQEKIDSSSAQLSRVGEELRDAKGLTQGYQKELASLQRSLNIKVDSGHDLASQIADLGQAMRKLQKDNEALTNQSSSLRTSLENQRIANTRLLGENDDLKSSNKQMRDTINTLTSKEDSLARQYIQLKDTSEKLESVTLAVRNLATRIVEEKTAGGYYFGKANVYLRNTLLGSMEWRIPSNLSHNLEKPGEASFSMESIDYVRVAPEERRILHSLGERLKFQVRLVSPVPTMEVQPGREDAIQEVGERDRATWSWTISNRGTQDARLLLTVHLVNKNSDDIPLMQQDIPIMSASAVRQVRNYLQPIPLSAGVVIGFLLFGIIGIFRRAKSPKPYLRGSTPGPIQSSSGTKKL